MTQEEIIKGNKLIAEFEHRKFFGNLIDKFGEGTFNELPEMKYHTSWSWLMPVVEKIESKGYCVFIQNDCCWMQVGRAGMRLPIITNLADCKIDAVYKTIIEFITWYNTQTPNQ